MVTVHAVRPREVHCFVQDRLRSNSPPPSAEVKNEWSLVSTRLHSPCVPSWRV
jgi:hypothetical protein